MYHKQPGLEICESQFPSFPSFPTLILRHVALRTQRVYQLLLGVLGSLSSQALVHLLLALLTFLLSFVWSLVCL